MELKQKRELRKFIENLEKFRGRHTELVSVYVPAGYEMVKIIHHLQEEQGTASNIKDKRNRQNVIDSLERVIRHLRLFKQTPPNGLAVFGGNISDKENQIDIQVFSIEPPQPLNIRIYRCDQTFVVDILKNMLEHNELYGLIVIDRREGTLGLLKGTYISKIANFTSDVPGKTTKGGQCLIFGTKVNLADGSKVDIFELDVGIFVRSYDFNNKKFINSKVIDKWKVEKKDLVIINGKLKCSNDHLIFLHDGSTKPAEKMRIGDVMIDGAGKEVKVWSIKKEKDEYSMIDLSVENKSFVANGILVHNSQQRYARLREEAAHNFFKRVGEATNKEFSGLEGLKGILVGGPGPTKEDFLEGDYLHARVKEKIIGVKDLSYTGEFGLNELVDKSYDVLSQEGIIEEKKAMERFFNSLSAKGGHKGIYKEEEIRRALERGAVDTLLLSETLDDKLIEELEKMAENTGAKVEMISIDTVEGGQLRDLGGLGAILRFNI